MPFTFGAVTLEFVLGLGVALLLWRDDWFNRIALGLLLIPATVTPLVVGLIFKALLSPEYGMLGYPLAELGLSGPRGLLADPQRALATLIAIDAWEWTPLMALILLAGLKNLPTDILEAAAVDGANGPQRFWLMVLPLLMPAAFLALIFRMMDAFRVFDIIFVTTSGGPADATNTLMIYGVKQGLEFFNIGAASAVSTVIVVCILLMAAAFIAVLKPGQEPACLIATKLLLILRRLAICAILVIALAPVLWLFSIAYKPTRDIFASPPTFLFTPTLDNFDSVFRYFKLGCAARVELHHCNRVDGAVALSRRPGRLCPGAIGKSARDLARLFLSHHPHRTADRDAHPVLPSDARRRPFGHVVGGDHPQHRAQQRLCGLDDVFFLSRRTGFDRRGGADGRLYGLRRLLPHRPADCGSRPDRQRHFLRHVFLE